MFELALSDVRQMAGRSILTDDQAVQGGNAIKAKYGTIVPSSDYTWFLIGRSELPDERLFYWQDRILNRLLSLAQSGIIEQDHYRLGSELAMSGLLWLPLWRGSKTADSDDATIAVWQKLGLLDLRNEYVADATQYMSVAASALRAKAEWYDVAYKVVSTLSVTENLKKLRDAAKIIQDVNLATTEMEARANAYLPPEIARDFVLTEIDPLRANYKKTANAISAIGITNEEAGLGFIGAAVAIGLGICAVIVTYYATYAQRKATDAKNRLLKLIEDNKKDLDVNIDAEIDSEEAKIYKMLENGEIPPSEAEGLINYYEQERATRKATVAADAIQKAKDANNIKVPSSGLGDIVKWLAIAGGVGVTAYVAVNLIPLLVKGK